MRFGWICLFLTIGARSPAIAQPVNLDNLHIVTGTATRTNAERSAAIMLADEIRKRIGVSVPVSATWPASGNIILLQRASGNEPALIAKPESFYISSHRQHNRTVIVVEG